MTNIRYNWNEAYNKFMNTRFIEIRKKLSLKDSTSEINPEIINKALIPYIENEKNRVITIPKLMKL